MEVKANVQRYTPVPALSTASPYRTSLSI